MPAVFRRKRLRSPSVLPLLLILLLRLKITFGTAPESMGA